MNGFMWTVVLPKDKGNCLCGWGFQKDYRVDKKLFDEIYELAEQYNGYYSKYYMSAFLFLTAANRAAFLKAGREKYGLPYENREEQNLSKGKVFNAEEMQVSDDQRYGNNHFYVDHCLHTQKKIKTFPGRIPKRVLRRQERLLCNGEISQEAFRLLLQIPYAGLSVLSG